MPLFYDEDKKKKQEAAAPQHCVQGILGAGHERESDSWKDMEENMTPDELKVIQERKNRNQVITVDDEDNPNALDPSSI